MDHYVTGAVIRALREKLGMTQAELAEKLCVSDKTVSKWETGRVDHAQDVLARTVDDDICKCILTVVPVIDPLELVIRKFVDKGHGFFLGKNGTDPFNLGLVIKRYIKDLRLSHEKRLQNIVFLRLLTEEADIFDRIYLANAAACINNVVSNLKAHIDHLSYIFLTISEKTICKFEKEGYNN